MLTDKNYKILTLLRTHRDDNAGIVLLGNHPYPRERFRAHRRLKREEMDAALEGTPPPAAVSAEEEEREEKEEDEEAAAAMAKVSLDGEAAGGGGRGGGGGGGESRKPKTVREALCRALGHGPPLVEHAARAAGLAQGGATPLPLSDVAQIDALFAQLSLLDDWFEGVTSGAVEPEGIITMKKHRGGGGGLGGPIGKEPLVAAAAAATKEEEEEDVVRIYDEFTPLRLAQHPATPATAPPPASKHSEQEQEQEQDVSVKLVEGGFDAALDSYFAVAEAQAERLARERAEKSAAARLEKVRRDQEIRAAQLEREKEKEELRATLIEYNLERVDTVLTAVNSALAGGEENEEGRGCLYCIYASCFFFFFLGTVCPPPLFFFSIFSTEASTRPH